MAIKDHKIIAHKALRLVSCKRRTDTAMLGNIVAKQNITCSTLMPIILSIDIITKLIIVHSNDHHQNSDRDARPEKVAYFLKQVLID